MAVHSTTGDLKKGCNRLPSHTAEGILERKYTFEAFMTDACGKVFISYKRERQDEIAELVRVLHEHGVPTWRDVDDLGNGQTEAEIDRVMMDEGATCGAVFWASPEVEHSPVIRRIELRGAAARYGRANGFDLLLVPAGGSSYAEAAEALGQYAGIHDLRTFNHATPTSNPASPEDLVAVAARVSRARLKAIHKQLAPGEPLRIHLSTRDDAAPVDAALHLNWHHHFKTSAQSRQASPDAWDRLLGALARTTAAIRREMPGRAILASGNAALPATVALGASLPTTAGTTLSWIQRFPEGQEETWSHSIGAAESGFVTTEAASEPSGTEAAVLVSVTGDVQRRWRERPLPNFRVAMHVSAPEPSPKVSLSAPQAADVAKMVEVAIRRARDHYGAVGRLHLFLAVPDGLSMLIGQKLNTVTEVQTYEFIDGYSPAALVHPS
ncbi:MAG: SAVED domain-containing protein [Alphaproteobacteria bacterium]|nr:SAVED domain-containing protein [Alphaproteobacteria bacterium]